MDPHFPFPILLHLVRRIRRQPQAHVPLQPNRETKQKTLEEIAAAFGDKVVLLDETDLAVEGTVMEDKIRAVQVENAPAASAKV